MSKILLVEDDELVRFALSEYLRHAKHQVIEAVDGKEALRLVTNDIFDIVVTDIVMPNMEGMELITRLKMSKPSLPVIAISGGGRIDKKEYLLIARDLGACAIMEKPVDPATLLDYIHQNAIA